MDEEVKLTVTGHAIRSEVWQAINKVLAASSRDISWAYSAVPYVAVHVSKLIELAEEKCLAGGKHVIHSYDVQSTLRQLVATQPVAEILDATPGGLSQIEDVKITPTQASDCLALREQILASARVIYDAYDDVELLMKSCNSSIVAFIIAKSRDGIPAAMLIGGCGCDSDLAALQSLDAILKAKMADRYP
ncbi:hypothetical protein B0A48_15530 [Cryoendolithus antarcticus]|uniref:Uncharacterized protein n=1 Tax=Cryoendolithus antarcticus TaxID=1507870 RepID=A0A1V8SGH4_9PEZI|nr:hypothetical protein B0A48_15530 [Cryoendolithus antarcticus]